MTTIDQVIARKIGSWMVGEWPVGNLFLCIIALILSVILCGAVGIERERRGRTAGLRTHLLVGVGSCVIMIISIYGFPAIYVEGTLLTRDVARLAAQVITGVGFLGAGAIIHRSSGTKGLTTAATIWIVMAIGLACGSMNFILAITSTVLIIVVLTVFRKVEARINGRAPLVMLRAKAGHPIVSKLLEAAAKFDCHVHDLHVDLLDEGDMEVTFFAQANSAEIKTNEFVAALEGVEGVISVGIINSHKA